MASRPTTNRTWAQNAETEDISEPQVERDRGFQRGESLPNSQLNWLLRELFEWVDYFDDKFQNADGVIDFFSDIDFSPGDYADWILVAEGTGFYNKALRHSGTGIAQLTSDVMEGLEYVLGDEFRPLSGDVINVRQSDGSDGAAFNLRYLIPNDGDLLSVVDSPGGAARDLLIRSLTATGSISVDAIEPDADTEVAIFDGTGTLGVLRTFKTITESFLETDDIKPRTNTKRINFSEQAAAAGSAENFSRTNILAYGKVEWDGSADEWNLVGGDHVNIESVEGLSSGFQVILDDDFTHTTPSPATVIAQWDRSGADPSLSDTWFNVSGRPVADGDGNLSAIGAIAEIDLTNDQVVYTGSLPIPDGVRATIHVFRPH